MKRKQKWLTAALLGLVLLCVLPVTARAADFHDVAEDSLYMSAVTWATEQGITVGTDRTAFSPAAPCTRAQVMTFLWRAKGAPTPQGTDTPFTDVTPEDYFYQPVLWAVETGITVGTGETTFSPDAVCRGREIITFLYRALYGVEASLGGDTYYARAWEWIASNGYDAGMEFDPAAPCTRAMTVAFLYRDAGAPGWELTVWVDGEARPGLYRDGQAFLTETDGTLLPIEQAGCRWQMDLAQHQAFVSTVPPVDTAALAGRRIPILMYHAVSDDVWGIESLFVSPGNMRAQLEYLRENDYEPIFFSDLAHIDDYEKPILLTFDDGYRDNYEELFPLLREFCMKATVFSISNTFGSQLFLTADQAKEMYDSGLVDIQSHTADHCMLSEHNGAVQEEQMAISRRDIARVTKHIPYVLCYPSGRYDGNTKTIGPRYYDFGLRSGGGIWRADGNCFAVTRIRIDRDTDLQTYARLIAGET